MSVACVCVVCVVADPTWASINLGLFMCIDCSGVHRHLGTHITKVKSCTLDSWKDAWVQFMSQVGNDVANGVWEAKLDSATKQRLIRHNSPREYVPSVSVRGVHCAALLAPLCRT